MSWTDEAEIKPLRLLFDRVKLEEGQDREHYLPGKAIATFELGESLSFLGGTFKVINREDEITSYEQLYTHLVANEPTPKQLFTLQFMTPTSF